MSSSRRRKLDAVVARLQLEHGRRAIRRAGPDERTPPAPRIATSFTELDAALGGGLPQGRISEIAGTTTSGKLTLAAKTIATAQRADREALAAWGDPHGTCDPDYLHRCGVVLDQLLIVRPATVSDALAMLLHLVRSRALAVLVCDWTPQAGTGSFTVGEEAELGGTLAQLNYLLTNTSIAVIFLTESTGTSASLAHAAAVRIRLQREQWLMHRGDVRGYAGQVEVIKNRLGRAGARVPLRIEFNGTVRGAGL